MCDATWNAAIKAAAGAALRHAAKHDEAAYDAREVGNGADDMAHRDLAVTAEVIAASIRALRRPEPARCDCGCGVHQIECDREGEQR